MSHIPSQFTHLKYSSLASSIFSVVLPSPQAILEHFLPSRKPRTCKPSPTLSPYAPPPRNTPSPQPGAAAPLLPISTHLSVAGISVNGITPRVDLSVGVLHLGFQNVSRVHPRECFIPFVAESYSCYVDTTSFLPVHQLMDPYDLVVMGN